MPQPPPTKPRHHRAAGFQNNHVEFTGKSLADVLRWRWNATRQGLPPAPTAPIPSTPPDLAFLHANARAGAAMRPTVTWIGHATVMAQLGGLTLLTDPIFSHRASPLQFAGPARRQPPGIKLHELPHIDLVLASHNHYDHLDDASVQALCQQAGGPPLFVVPLGLKAWLAARGVHTAVELDWWEQNHLRGVDVALVPAQH